MEENLALPVAAEVHMDSAPTASFVAEKNCGAHSELVDLYFAGVRHLLVSILTRQIVGRLLRRHFNS